MAWQQEMVAIVRNMVNDADPTNYTYSDARMQALITVSAQLVVQECGTFSQAFVVDIPGTGITPDPTVRTSVPPTRDDNFINLVCIKSGCLLDMGECRTFAAQAVDVRDQGSAVNLVGRARVKLDLAKQGWCAAYEEAKMQYLAGSSSVVGTAVLGPFRIFETGGRGTWPYRGFYGSDDVRGFGG